MKVLAEAARLTYLTFRPDSVRKPPAYSTVQGEPRTALLVPGLLSTGRHLADLGEAVSQALPAGSEVFLYTPSTGINIAPAEFPNFGFTRWVTDVVDFRRRETKQLGETMSRLRDIRGPIITVAHSLGGPMSLEAWMQREDAVDTLITEGSPHRIPFVGILERPDRGELHTITGAHDVFVPPWLATHPGQDSTTRVPVDHFGLLTEPEAFAAVSALLPAQPEPAPLPFAA